MPVTKAIDHELETLVQQFKKHFGQVNHVEVITEDELQSLDATLQVFLQQHRHQIQTIDEVSLGEFRGGQEMIQEFIEYNSDEPSRHHVLMELFSAYSVEVFLSSRANRVEIRRRGWQPSFYRERIPEHLQASYRVETWKVLIPYRFIGQS